MKKPVKSKNITINNVKVALIRTDTCEILYDSISRDTNELYDKILNVTISNPFESSDNVLLSVDDALEYLVKGKLIIKSGKISIDFE